MRALLLTLLLATTANADEMEVTTKVQMEIKDLQAIVQYLADRPYREVVQLIQPALNAKAVEDCKKPKDDEDE